MKSVLLVALFLTAPAVAGCLASDPADAVEFFAETLGSSYVGILVAGLFVFAISPLSRFADRVAARAVPAATSQNEFASSDDEATYRVALRKFLRDGNLTRDEERHLTRLATRLGIDAERAVALRHQVEDARPAREVG